MFRLPDKGTFAYFKNRKKVTGRLTVIGFLTVLVIFLTGVIIYHNNKSIFTVIAAVAVLPAAKMLVTYIITAGFESVSKEKYDEISGIVDSEEKGIVLCDILLASKEKSMIAGMVVLCDGNILMYTDSKKANPQETENYVKEIMQNCNYTSIKQYTDFVPFKNRVAGTVSAIKEGEMERRKTMQERMEKNILIYTV